MISLVDYYRQYARDVVHRLRNGALGEKKQGIVVCIDDAEGILSGDEIESFKKDANIVKQEFQQIVEVEEWEDERSRVMAYLLILVEVEADKSLLEDNKRPRLNELFAFGYDIPNIPPEDIKNRLVSLSLISNRK